MRWTWTWGTKYDKLVAAVTDASELPFVQNAPTLSDTEAFYAQAFLTLSNSRDTGFGVGPIKFSEIAAYLSVFEVPDVEAFIVLIQAMDMEYLELQVEKHGNTRKTKHSSK